MKGSKMKKVLLLLTVLLLSGCASLIPTQEQITGLENDLAALNNAIDAKQLEAKTKFGEFQSKIDEVNKAIQTSGSVLEAAQNVNSATAPLNPYSGLIDNALGIVAALTVGGGAVAYKKNKDNNRVIANINRVAAESSPEEGRKIMVAINGK